MGKDDRALAADLVGWGMEESGMCIICNMPDFKDEVASAFLDAFERSRREMQAAAAAMLECSRIANTPEARKRYDATHKEMVRQIREWNKLEEKREH